MKDMGKSQFAAVGRCIYCGVKNDLRREHIVPFGLSGTAVLPKATCKQCEKITSNIERNVLRGPMWAVRVLRNLKSRRPNDAPKTERLTIIKDGAEQTIELPIDKFPILLHFPIYRPPSFLFPENYVNGIIVTGYSTINFGTSLEEALSNYRPCEIRYKSHSYRWFDFARMIAKIAYCMDVGEGLMHEIKGESMVLPAIMGKSNDVGRWVGTFANPFETHKGLLHRILLHKDSEKQLLIGEVQLFADSETPRYGVILGRLK